MRYVLPGGVFLKTVANQKIVYIWANNGSSELIMPAKADIQHTTVSFIEGLLFLLVLAKIQKNIIVILLKGSLNDVQICNIWGIVFIT